MEVLNNVSKPALVQRHIRLYLYKTLFRPNSCYGSEEWTVRK